MPVITICSLKGGTGKSTITLNLAGALSVRGRKVLVIDADPQGTVSGWTDISKQDEPTVLIHPAADIHKQIDKVRAAFDFILIDTPPASAEVTRSAILAADKLIMPITPGLPDVLSLEKLISIYGKALEYKPALDARILLNRVDRRTLLSQTIRAYLKKRFDLKIFNVEISQLAVFGAAFLEGKTVEQYAPRSRGAKEFKKLSKGVLSW